MLMMIDDGPPTFPIPQKRGSESPTGFPVRMSVADDHGKASSMASLGSSTEQELVATVHHAGMVDGAAARYLARPGADGDALARSMFDSRFVTRLKVGVVECR